MNDSDLLDGWSCGLALSIGADDGDEDRLSDGGVDGGELDGLAWAYESGVDHYVEAAVVRSIDDGRDNRRAVAAIALLDRCDAAPARR